MYNPHSLRSFFLAALLATLCFSTGYTQQRFTAGPRVGVNISNYLGDNASMKGTVGLAAGAFLMYSSLNHFGISGDILYSQRGAKFDDGTKSFTQRVNYLEIPIVARYFLTLSGKFRPNLFVGPSVGFKLNAKTVNGQSIVGPLVNGDNSDRFNGFDLGATGGIQLNWSTGSRQHFLIDARYLLGLANAQAQPHNLWGARSLYNSGVTVTLGYGFGVGPEYRSRYRK